MMVDTSVWIDFFHGRLTSQVQFLKSFVLYKGTILTGDLIIAELFQGIKNKREMAVIESAFQILQIKPMVGETIARKSADYYRQLRRSGITIRKTIDCLIAAWCIHNQVPLLHSDRDFAHFARFGLIERIPQQ